jgi:hypothetical protein
MKYLLQNINNRSIGTIYFSKKNNLITEMDLFTKPVKITTATRGYHNIFSKWGLQSNKFRSFFGFFKPKPFIKNCTNYLLDRLYLNPKSYNLKIFIQNTKIIPKLLISSFFIPKYEVSSTVSKLMLKEFLLKKNKSGWAGFQYNLIKHKLYNYTTSKAVKINQYMSLRTQLHKCTDLRTGLSSAQKPYNGIPNLDTISTYNWKSIN